MKISPVKSFMRSTSIPLWRNVRFLECALQSISAVALIALLVFLGANLFAAAQNRGLSFDLDFLHSAAGFDIGESLIEYDPSRTFAYAFLVGILNTLKVALLGIVGATLLGVLIGIARLSSNWLVRKIATVYIETIRNIPLLVQLFIWYFVVFQSLPHVEQSIELFDAVRMNNRGIFFGESVRFTPEFMSLLMGLLVYTSSFIAEIVRAGIQSVARGQKEAAEALGLPAKLILFLIVLPQALRVIIPPLISQHLNLSKNSSLAILIGYPDLFFVGKTLINQAGRAIPVIMLIMGVYLLISFFFAVFGNLYNRRMQLVEA